MGFNKNSSSTNSNKSSRNDNDDGLKGLKELHHEWLKPVANFVSNRKFRQSVLKRIRQNIKNILNIFSCSVIRSNFINCCNMLIDWKRTGSIVIVILSSWVLTYFLLEKVAPFGIDQALDSYSESIIDRMAAPFYTSNAQDEIVVVLINDKTLEGEAWPPHYDWYSRLLNRVLKNQPKAVFFDVQFNNFRAEDNTLEKARKELSEDLAKYKVPLILAQGLDTSRKNVFGDIKGVELSPVEWANFGGNYPLLLPVNHLSDDQNDSVCDPDKDIVTPAMRLYREACSSSGGGGCTESAKHLSGEALCNPLTPHWGRSVSKTMVAKKLVRTGECDLVDPTDIERFKAFGKSIWHIFISGFDSEIMERTRQHCAYTVTVYAHDLTNFDKVHDVLKDKIVLIGSGLSALHDLVSTPVHGQLPGVYLHAMALDNLMTYGREYYSHSSGDTIELILIVVAIAVSWVVAAVLRAKPPFYQLVLRIFTLLLVSVLSYILYFCYHYPAVHWLSFLLLYELIIHLIPHQTKQPNHSELT